jgi:hypothetical protein
VRFIQHANTLAVKFYNCRLKGVLFTGVNLSFAHFQDSFCENVDFGVSDIEGGGLAGATFKDCRFGRVSFKNASLSGTVFDSCLLYGAELEEANFLTAAQLTNVITLYGASMPKPISEELRRSNPHLFQPPKVITFDHFRGVAFFPDASGTYRTGRVGKAILRGEIENFEDSEFEKAKRALAQQNKKFEIRNDVQFFSWEYPY